MDGYEQYDEVYSISDLHLTAGARVDRDGVAGLTATIEALANRATITEKRTALVINGDIVDFLDIEPYWYFDPLGAPGKLQQVFNDNASFWDALKKFAKAHAVVMTLGNHDIELAMPACQAMLRRQVGGNLTLAFDGAGYRCRVGSATALFLHGNNEDPWNEVDFDALGRVAACINAGVPYKPWVPNEGTKLVIEVLNAQKRLHPFLEYVKPEKGWLFELISMLDFGTIAAQAIKLGPRQAAATTRWAARSWTARAQYLGEGRGAGGTTRDGGQLLLDADTRFRRGEEVLRSSAGSGSLGLVRNKRESPEAIQAHIKKSLVGDTTFVVQQSDDIYEALGPKLGPGIHFVVCGHTHLRRAFQERDSRAYFNSGTWMRLLDLWEPSDTPGQFDKVLQALDTDSVATLDKIEWTDAAGTIRKLVLREPTIVMLSAENHRGWLARGALGRNDTLDFAAIANSEVKVTP